jgi:hypothetical protein
MLQIKRTLEKDETKNKIPSDSLPGQMLKYWLDNLGPKAKRSSK